jgi:hypothetical protein
MPRNGGLQRGVWVCFLQGKFLHEWRVERVSKLRRRDEKPWNLPHQTADADMRLKWYA